MIADRGAWPPIRAGIRAALPLSAGVFPFGLAYGVAVTESVVPDWVGGLASLVIIAGASQLSLLESIDEDVPALVAILTALVINARFVMYSGALAPSFAQYPRRWRFGLVHLMTDQAATISLLHNEVETDPRRRRLYYLGAGGSFVAVWVLGTWLGVLFGDGIPDSWQLDFAVPVMFVALLVPTLRDRPSVVAASVAASLTVLLRDAPSGTGLLVGAVTGIAVALATDR